MKQGWEIKKLGEVCAKLTDGSHNPPKGVNHGNFIMLSSQNIFNDYLSYDDVRFLQEEDFIREDKRTCVREGDVLLTIVGTIGRCAVFTGSKNVTLQRSVAVLHPHESLLSRFLMYCLIGRNTSLNEQAHGIAQKGIYLKQLALITIPVPPLPEQKKIVSELDCLSGILDKKRQQLKELDALAQSIFYEMFGDPVTNERGWEVKKLKDVFSVKIGPFGSLLHNSDYVSGGTPLVNPIHMQNETICPDNDFTVSEEKIGELQNYRLSTGDVVFARRGDIGRCALVREKDNGFLCGTGSLFVRPIQPINSSFFVKMMRCESMIEHLTSSAKGATMLNINCKIIEELEIILPPLPLQQTFATKIEAIEAQKALIKQSLGEVETLFNSRMQEYFG